MQTQWVDLDVTQPTHFLNSCLSFSSFLDSQVCTQGSVRLLWGQGSWEGNVQICNNGIWGWVCHNTWDNLDAQVVCTQLGYTATGTILHIV